MFLRQTLWTVPPITALGASISGAIVLALYLLLVPLTALLLARVVQQLADLHAAILPPPGRRLPE